MDFFFFPVWGLLISNSLNLRIPLLRYETSEFMESVINNIRIRLCIETILDGEERGIQFKRGYEHGP